MVGSCIGGKIFLKTKRIYLNTDDITVSMRLCLHFILKASVILFLILLLFGLHLSSVAIINFLLIRYKCISTFLSALHIQGKNNAVSEASVILFLILPLFGLHLSSVAIIHFLLIHSQMTGLPSRGRKLMSNLMYFADKMNVLFFIFP